MISVLQMPEPKYHYERIWSKKPADNEFISYWLLIVENIMEHAKNCFFEIILA